MVVAFGGLVARKIQGTALYCTLSNGDVSDLQDNSISVTSGPPLSIPMPCIFHHLHPTRKTMSFGGNEYFWRAVEQRAGFSNTSRTPAAGQWTKMFGKTI
jgi:hypothetical protein